MEAKSQTPPSFILIAVDLPPKGMMPNLAKGLGQSMSYVERWKKKPGSVVPRKSPHISRNLEEGIKNAERLGEDFIYLTNDCLRHGLAGIETLLRH